MVKIENETAFLSHRHQILDRLAQMLGNTSGLDQ
eukprot:COSAG06_NODE_6796_length_2778_cov_5.645763_1_plen_34_part_00